MIFLTVRVQVMIVADRLLRDSVLHALDCGRICDICTHALTHRRKLLRGSSNDILSKGRCQSCIVISKSLGLSLHGYVTISVKRPQ